MLRCLNRLNLSQGFLIRILTSRSVIGRGEKPCIGWLIWLWCRAPIKTLLQLLIVGKCGLTLKLLRLGIPHNNRTRPAFGYYLEGLHTP